MSTPIITEDVFYGRHFRLPGFSAATQEKLRRARVLIVGMGGLGCPAAMYLAGAGVGNLTLLDADVVSATNLHRQVLFDASCVGRKKVEVAAQRLRTTNPFIAVETVDTFADADWLSANVGRFDLVVDGTDNFSAKFAINDACEDAGVPLVFGSIFQFEGQVSVFHLRSADGTPGCSYRDLFRDAPPPTLAQNCGEAGVVGVLPGVIGTLQATEAVKIITGLGTPLHGELLTYDALSATMRKLSLGRRAVSNQTAGEALQIEDYLSIVSKQRAGEGPTLVDVREDNERAQSSIGGLHIPLASLPGRLREIPLDRDVVVYCKSGVRSARAALYLQTVLAGVQVSTLRGGMDSVSGLGIACSA